MVNRERSGRYDVFGDPSSDTVPRRQRPAPGCSSPVTWDSDRHPASRHGAVDRRAEQCPAQRWTKRPGVDRLFQGEAELAEAGIQLGPSDAEGGRGLGLVALRRISRPPGWRAFSTSLQRPGHVPGPPVGRRPPLPRTVSWGTIPKCVGGESPPSETMSARSTAFASSRILPGHRCDTSRLRASRLSPTLAPTDAQAQLPHEGAGPAGGCRRSRSGRRGGRCTLKTLRR